MPFISPFDLLEPDERDLENELLRQAVRRARRRWLSEFQLGEEAVIGAARFSRDTVLKLLDELDDPKRALLHRKLYVHRVYEFLNGGFPSSVWPVLDVKLKQFCAPHFTEAWVSAFKEAFLACDVAKLEKLQELITPGWEEEYVSLLAPLHSFFHTQAEAIGVIIGEQDGAKEVLDRLTNEAFVWCWNQLPPHFQPLRNRVAELYLALYRHYIAKPDSFKLRKRILHLVKELELDGKGERARATIQRLHARHSPWSPPDPADLPEHARSFPGFRGHILLVAVILALSMIAGILRSCEQPPEPDPEPGFQRTLQQETYLKNSGGRHLCVLAFCKPINNNS